MARIAGVDLPKNKRILFALPYIYGIGRSSAKNILQATGIDPMKKVSELSEEEIALLRKEIEVNHKVEGMLRADLKESIKRLIQINCYRGIRHKMGLPVRGQRTRTNARTWKGPRKSSFRHTKKKGG